MSVDPPKLAVVRQLLRETALTETAKIFISFFFLYF